MKLRVTFKDPDSLSECVRAEVRKSLMGMPLSDAEKEAAAAVRYEETYEKACEWLQYGEYLVVEVDTDEGTCVVVKP